MIPKKVYIFPFRISPAMRDPPMQRNSTFYVETFLVFSQDIPSNSLGFVDSKATSLDFSIGGHDYEVRQSPTLLSSNRKGGTTGAGRLP
jgi:hypothetical protein